MKLFIPELGTKLKLTKDWTFDLYYERRNRALLPGKNSKKYIPDEWITEPQKTILSRPAWIHEWETPEDYLKTWGSKLPASPIGMRYGERYFDVKRTSDWKIERDSKRKNQVTFACEGTARFIKKPEKFTFPAETILTVERIYIRKGQEDYDSMSFRTRLNNKSVRFWAKLSDVNNIEFELEE